MNKIANIGVLAGSLLYGCAGSSDILTGEILREGDEHLTPVLEHNSPHPTIEGVGIVLRYLDLNDNEEMDLADEVLSYTLFEDRDGNGSYDYDGDEGISSHDFSRYELPVSGLPTVAELEAVGIPTGRD